MALTAYAQEQQEGDFPPPPPPKLSAEKKAEMDKKIEALKTTCATDIANLCAGDEGPRIIGCLKHQKESVTVSACSDTLAQFPDHPPRPPRQSANNSAQQ
jgi:hypothetical protein